MNLYLFFPVQYILYIYIATYRYKIFATGVGHRQFSPHLTTNKFNQIYYNSYAEAWSWSETVIAKMNFTVNF